jgi:uncharacterized protein
MFIPDVNILVYACNARSRQYAAAIDTLGECLDSPGGIGVSSLAISGLVRVNLQTRFLDNPSGISVVLDFADGLLSAHHCRPVEPTANHWPIFREILRAARFGHRKTTDAWFAALAIEHGATLVSFDGGFAQFESSGLSWKHVSA